MYIAIDTQIKYPSIGNTNICTFTACILYTPEQQCIQIHLLVMICKLARSSLRLSSPTADKQQLDGVADHIAATCLLSSSAKPDLAGSSLIQSMLPKGCWQVLNPSI